MIANKSLPARSSRVALVSLPNTNVHFDNENIYSSHQCLGLQKKSSLTFLPIAWAHNCPFPMVVELDGKPCEPISRSRGLLNRFCHIQIFSKTITARPDIQVEWKIGCIVLTSQVLYCQQIWKTLMISSHDISYTYKFQLVNFILATWITSILIM